jgi:hypothetical protein
MKYLLKKRITENIFVYFKCTDKTGHTNTDSKEDAKSFNFEEDARYYNHRYLYSSYLVVLL